MWLAHNSCSFFCWKYVFKIINADHENNLFFLEKEKNIFCQHFIIYHSSPEEYIQILVSIPSQENVYKRGKT